MSYYFHLHAVVKKGETESQTIYVLYYLAFNIAFNSHCKHNGVLLKNQHGCSTDVKQFFYQTILCILSEHKEAVRVKETCCMEMYGLAGHCFYWAAFSFFLHKVSFFCSCSADLSIDAKCDLRSSKEGISTFCFSDCKHDWLLLLWNYHPSFFSQSSPSLPSGFRSFCLCSARPLDRETLIFPLPLLRGTFIAEVILFSCWRHVTWCV